MQKIRGSSETTREITKLDKNFYSWFIGFLEGDGSFFIRSNDTLGFEVSQKSTDTSVLYEIKSKLGLGSVNHNTKINVSRFVLSSKKASYLSLIKIINIDDLRLIKRRAQYEAWIKKAELLSGVSIIENQAYDVSKAPKLPSFEDSWLSGFIDAEGCFRIHYEKSNNKYRPIFQITQDEIEILEKIKNLFGKKHRGSIYKDRNTYVLSISGKEARNLIIDYINKFPLKTHKRISFEKWVDCHNLLAEPITSDNPEVVNKLEMLKETINKFS